MNLKLLVMKRGLTQLQIAKLIGVNPALLSMQINKHRLLPEKHLEKFCQILEISKESVIASMTEGGSND